MAIKNPYDIPGDCRCAARNDSECGCGRYVDPGWKRMWQEGHDAALRLVRQVEADMADSALKARRSADARRGLSDYVVLEIHADTLTRWSERLRMAFEGVDYRGEGS